MSPNRPAAPARPVLLVEDNRDDIHFVRRAFERDGLVNRLIVTPTAAAARGALSSSPADAQPLLILVDVTLGDGESGLQLMEWLRRQPPPLGSTPVVMYTVSVDRTEEARATALGALGFLRKPITPEALIDAVTAVGLLVDPAADGNGRVIHE